MIAFKFQLLYKYIYYLRVLVQNNIDNGEYFKRNLVKRIFYVKYDNVEVKMQRKKYEIIKTTFGDDSLSRRSTTISTAALKVAEALQSTDESIRSTCPPHRHPENVVTKKL